MQNISVLVINLDRRPDRMAYMIRELKKLGLPYTRIPAVDAESPANNWLTRGKLAEISGIPMTIGEHAVHASHYAAWQNAAEQDLDAALILEDDAVLSPDLAHIFESGKVPSDADIVKLEAYYGEIELGHVASRFCNGRDIRRLHSVILGAAGYLVTRSGIEKLTSLVKAEEIKDPLDWMLFHRKSDVFKNITVYQANPALVIQMEYFEGSQDPELSRSDVEEDRIKEFNTSKPKNTPQSLIRRSIRFGLRIKSRLKGRRRIKIAYRH